MFRNASDQPIAFRDDAGKHHVAPGGTFDIVGAQHAAAVLEIPGVEEVQREQAGPRETTPATPEPAVSVPTEISDGAVDESISPSRRARA